MRRIVVILLTLVVAPSMATASWYRCAYDGAIRSECCCPTKPDQPNQKKTPAPGPSVRAACCCTVTHLTSRAPDGETTAAASLHIDPTTLSAPSAVVVPRVARAAVAIDRPRAQGDPLDTLLARRCSLLL